METIKVNPQGRKKSKYWEMLSRSRLVQANSKVDADIKHSWEKHQLEKDDQDDRVIDYFLNALSPSSVHPQFSSKDIEVMSKALYSVYEALQESILSEREADILIEFLITKFVKRRFGSVLSKVLNVEKEYKHTFKAVRGSS